MNNIIFNNNLFHVERRERQYRRRPDYLLQNFTDDEIRQRYRFNRENIQHIIDLVHDDLVRETDRNCALSVSLQVQTGLRFLATNSFHLVIGDVVGIHKSTSCKVVQDFCNAINRHKNEFIRIPNENDTEDIKKGFFEVAGMPGVVGCIDCTHFKIVRPYENEADFVNRKGNKYMVLLHKYMVWSKVLVVQVQLMPIFRITKNLISHGYPWI